MVQFRNQVDVIKVGISIVVKEKQMQLYLKKIGLSMYTKSDHAHINSN